MATQQELETLRQRFAAILMSAACGRIRIRYGAVSITGNGYYVIGFGLSTALAHRTHHGRRREMGVRVGQMPQYADAFYHPQTNDIVVPHLNYGRTPYERRVIVHEATHAIFDFYFLRATGLENEALASVAEMMFRRFDQRITLPPAEIPALSPFERTVDEVAYELAPAHPLMAAWTDVVSSAQMARLIQAVRHLPGYAFLNRHPRYRYQNTGGSL
jgi:hypothetical protein